MSKKIYIIAGEASGDLHGANLIKALRAEYPEPLEIYGVGGDKIKDTGALHFLDLAHFHVTGITDVFSKLPLYKKASLKILQSIREVHPDVVVLIDNPGFNLHLAKKIEGLKIPMVYYIAPQIWAWAPERIKKIKRFISKVLVVFEFEKKIYEDHGVPVEWVGHPLRDLIPAKEISLDSQGKARICLLPGSRKGELKMLFSIFAKAAKIISQKIPDASFCLIQSPTLPQSFYDRLFKEARLTSCELIKSDSYRAIQKSDLAIVCSGTATLECALLGTPMIISNKGSFLTYLLAKTLIRVRFLGIPNLILNEARFPELLQYDATPEKIAAEAVRILGHSERRLFMKQSLRETSQKIGPSGSARRAALEILKFIK